MKLGGAAKIIVFLAGVYVAIKTLCVISHGGMIIGNVMNMSSW